MTTRPTAPRTPTSSRSSCHREDRAEEEGEQARIERPGGRDQHDARRDPGVEKQREGLVAGRLAACAEPLDRDSAEHRRHERRADRRDVEQVAERDAGEGDMADAVPDQAHPALHEEEAHRRREHAHDGPGREGEAHEIGFKDGHERVVPLAGQGRRWAVEDDSAAHQHEPLDELLHGAELVRDEEDRRVELVVQLGEQRRQRLLGVDVDAGRRLVEHQQVGLSGERLGDEGALLLAAGQRGDGLPRPLGQADALDGRLDESSVVRPQASNGAPPRDPARAHDLLHGHRRLDPELRTLGEVADAVALPKAAGRLAEERRCPGLRLLEPEQDTEQRRLAPAVRSGHGHELTLLHGETHVAEHWGPPGYPNVMP